MVTRAERFGPILAFKTPWCDDWVKRISDGLTLKIYKFKSNLIQNGFSLVLKTEQWWTIPSEAYSKMQKIYNDKVLKFLGHWCIRAMTLYTLGTIRTFHFFSDNCRVMKQFLFRILKYFWYHMSQVSNDTVWLVASVISDWQHLKGEKEFVYYRKKLFYQFKLMTINNSAEKLSLNI